MLRRAQLLVDGLLCLWPGLRGLWRHGRLSGLVVALLFAAILQTAVLTSLIWPDLIGAAARAVVCFSVVLFWLVFAVPELAQSAVFRRLSVESVDREHLFQSAQREYLKGNWFQAETLFERLIRLDAQDVEARFYLATMNRHIDRIDEAQRKLEELESVPAARRWQWEMRQERQLLVRRKRELVDSHTGRPGSVDAA